MNLSKRVDVLKASTIREVGKLIAAKDNCISFAGGLPSPDYIPVEEVRKITQKILLEDGEEALQYGATKGYAPLLKKIIKMKSMKNIDCGIENIQITTGSQQAISFCTMIFADKGDTIITENPTYLGALASFRPFECNVVGVEVDEEGMKMDELEKRIINNKNVKMIYVVPNFSNPTGRTWSLKRRKKLYEIAVKYDLPIIEDNPYGEIRFEGDDIPTIKSLDIDGRVIYLGSFSKVFCAGMRVGWIFAEKSLINKFEILKQGWDLQSNQLAQMQVNEYLANYNLDEQIKRIINGYKEKRDVMCEYIDEKFPESIKRTNPKGGMFVWLELPKGFNADDLLIKALNKNVGFVPGGSFYPKEGSQNTIRLNFSYVSIEEIKRGITILGELLNDEL